MKHIVIIRPEAENDLKEAFLWYEDKRKGLGHDFLLQVDVGMRAIERNPRVHPTKYKGTRGHFVKRFPYKIIYIFEEREIIILSILHGKRSPNLTKRRINNI